MVWEGVEIFQQFCYIKWGLSVDDIKCVYVADILFKVCQCFNQITLVPICPEEEQSAFRLVVLLVVLILAISDMAGIYLAT